MMDNEQLPKGYKNTEVGVIPEDWEVKNLLDACTLKARIGWQGLTTAEYLETGDYGLVTGTDFINGYIDWDNCVYVEKDRYLQDKNIQLKINDVLVTKDGTIGKVAFIDKLPNPTTLNSGVFVIRPKIENIDNQFFYYLLMSFYFDDFLSKITAGSTITHLYQKDFATFNFILPSKSEQTAIANALSDTDALINSLEKLIAKKRNIKQGAMQQLLKPKEGWEVKKLGELFAITAGGDLDIHNYSSIMDDKFCYPIYSNALTNKGLYGFSSEYKQVENTITVTARGQIGYAIPRYQKYTSIGRVLMLNPIEDLSIDFVSEYINNYIEFSNESTGVPQLTAPQISKYETILPSFEEQTRIATILSDMDAEIQALVTKLEKYRKIKLGMMQNLLTGKIRLI